MTHITDGRVIGCHADMGWSRGKEVGAAQSTWDSEGGAVGRDATDVERGSLSGGAEGLPQTQAPLGV
jgi:hypothetical protein